MFVNRSTINELDRGKTTPVESNVHSRALKMSRKTDLVSPHAEGSTGKQSNMEAYVKFTSDQNLSASSVF